MAIVASSSKLPLGPFLVEDEPPIPGIDWLSHYVRLGPFECEEADPVIQLGADFPHFVTFTAMSSLRPDSRQISVPIPHLSKMRPAFGPKERMSPSTFKAGKDSKTITSCPCK